MNEKFKLKKLAGKSFTLLRGYTKRERETAGVYSQVVRETFQAVEITHRIFCLARQLNGCINIIASYKASLNLAPNSPFWTVANKSSGDRERESGRASEKQRDRAKNSREFLHFFPFLHIMIHVNFAEKTDWL